MAASRNRFLEKMVERLHAALSTGPALNCRPHQSRQRVDLALVAALDGSKPEAVLARLLAGESVKITSRARAVVPAAEARASEAQAPSPSTKLPRAVAPPTSDGRGAATEAGSSETGSSETASSETASSETASSETLPSDPTETVPSSEVAPSKTLASEAEGALIPEPSRAEREALALLGKLRNVADDARTFEQDTGAHVLHVGFPLLQLPPGKLAGATKSGAHKRVLAPVAFVPRSA